MASKLGQNFVGSQVSGDTTFRKGLLGRCLREDLLASLSIEGPKERLINSVSVWSSLVDQMLVLSSQWTKD